MVEVESNKIDEKRTEWKKKNRRLMLTMFSLGDRREKNRRGGNEFLFNFCFTNERLNEDEFHEKDFHQLNIRCNDIRI